jgi:DNA glycosylase AlkZ-like
MQEIGNLELDNTQGSKFPPSNLPLLQRNKLQSYRDRTFRLIPELRVRTQVEAIEFINERGYVFFWPINGISLPSLWTAVAGDRPVADEHDDPGHISWQWKDSLLGTHTWFYAKVLRKKSTIISLEYAPFFYALSENFGSPEEDYLIQYQQGKLTQEAKLVYEALLFNGAMDTIALRKAARLAGQDKESQFQRALVDLQMDMKILPVGVAPVGRWRYAYIYDLVARHYPEIVQKARFIPENKAWEFLVMGYFLSVGASPLPDLTKLLGMTEERAQRVSSKLISDGVINKVRVEGQAEEWLSLSQLLGLTS